MKTLNSRGLYISPTLAFKLANGTYFDRFGSESLNALLLAH